MKLTYALLKGFKRFSNSRISELEAEFVSPVQIICASNSSGKSSLLRELSPLPSIRTDYEKDGLKELHIEHEGHSFVLRTDFTSRVSPHSFKMDGIELNEGHTSDIQEELSIKHFGFTPAIRNLVYSKMQMCSMTPVNRKEMFLNINPMDLSLIINSHKVAMTRYKDAKANLKLLYSRKGNLEAQMLAPDVLAQHQATKTKLTEELMLIDKVIYALEQHINTLRDRYREDLDYQQQCADNGRSLIPGEQILQECRRIVSICDKYTSVPRGDAFQPAKEELHLTQERLHQAKQEISRTIESLTAEINEYNTHLEADAPRSSSVVEQELKEVEAELAKYQNLPQNPIPAHLLNSYNSRIDEIKRLVFIFKDAEVKLLPVETVERLLDQASELKFSLDNKSRALEELSTKITNQETELANVKSKANIPSSCNSTTCGLKSLFDLRVKRLEDQHASDLITRSVLEKEVTELTTRLDTLSKQVEPYKRFDLLSRYKDLLNLLLNSYFDFKDWRSTLIDQLNTSPLQIVKELTEFLEGSKLCVERDQILQKKDKLTTELEVLAKSSGTSIEFLKQKIKEKEEQIKTHLKELKKIDKESTDADAQYALYLEYASVCRTVQEFNTLYEKGERALLVTNAIDYWKKLGRSFVEVKHSISEELRNIESIVREQEIIKHTYESETLHLIDTLSKDAIAYEKIVDALSPNSGIAHKSMVKYLNAMINNVNYFLSQLWTFKLAIKNVPLDKPLDYRLPIEIGTEVAGDINHLSDGQTEAVNLMWVLAILLQTKMLDKIPFFADEIGRAMDPVHRQHLLDFLNKLIDSKLVSQLFLVNHYAAISNGFTDSDIILLDGTNIPELPPEVNRHVRIVKY